MLDSFLNIAVLLLTALTGAVGVFGDTFDTEDKTKSFIRRIRATGWATIAAAIVTLGLGVVQDYLAKADAEEAEQEIQSISEDAEIARDKVVAQEASLKEIKEVLDKLERELLVALAGGDTTAKLANLEKSRATLQSSVAKTQADITKRENEEAARYAGARAAIKKVVQGGNVTFKNAVKARLTPYEAVLAALSSNKTASKSVREYGKTRTEKYVKELES